MSEQVLDDQRERLPGQAETAVLCILVWMPRRWPSPGQVCVSDLLKNGFSRYHQFVHVKHRKQFGTRHGSAS